MTEETVEPTEAPEPETQDPEAPAPSDPEPAPEAEPATETPEGNESAVAGREVGDDGSGRGIHRH